MLEAMSYGVIPIVSDGIGAMDSIITSGKNGFVCLLDNWSKQAYECLQHLADMPAEKLMAIKAETLKDYELNYKSENVALRLIGLIQNPTVNRDKRPNSIEVLKWHRPFRKDKLKAPLLDRIAIKLGYLRKQGTLFL